MSLKIFIIIIIGIVITVLIFVYLFMYYFPAKTGSVASRKFKEWQQVYGRLRASQMTVDWLRKQLIVKDVGISDDGTIWIRFKNRTEADISTYFTWGIIVNMIILN